MHSTVSDHLIKDAVFDAMLVLGVNYMPSLRQIKKIGSFTIQVHNKTVTGAWLARTIDRSGGVVEWRKQLLLLDKEEYEKKIKCNYYQQVKVYRNMDLNIKIKQEARNVDTLHN